MHMHSFVCNSIGFCNPRPSATAGLFTLLALRAWFGEWMEILGSRCGARLRIQGNEHWAYRFHRTSFGNIEIGFSSSRFPWKDFSATMLVGNENDVIIEVDEVSHWCVKRRELESKTRSRTKLSLSLSRILLEIVIATVSNFVRHKHSWVHLNDWKMQ